MKSRKGQYGDFWSCGQKNADGSWCKYKPPKPQNTDQKFGNEMAHVASKMDDGKKDDTINRLAVIKSLIEGGWKPGIEFARAFVWCLALAKDENPIVKGMKVQQPVAQPPVAPEPVPVAQAIIASENLPEEEEIPLDQIPF